LASFPDPQAAAPEESLRISAAFRQSAGVGHSASLERGIRLSVGRLRRHGSGPFPGVLPVPASLVKSGSPVLKNPLNYNRAVGLTYDEFRYAFANAVSEDEAKEPTTRTPCQALASRSSGQAPPT
jgi:hypothetical protein